MQKLSPLIFCLFISLILVPTVSADVKVEQGGSNVSVHVQNKVNSSNSVSINNNDSSNVISIHQNGDGDSKMVVNNDTFDLSGTIKTVTGKTFDLSGQNITVDSSKVSGFVQNTGLVPGEKVTVTGQIIDGTFYARVIDSNDDNPSNSNSINLDSPAPAPSIDPSATPTPSVSPSPSPSSIPTAAIKVKAEGPVSKLIDLLQNMVSRLQNMLI